MASDTASNLPKVNLHLTRTLHINIEMQLKCRSQNLLQARPSTVSYSETNPAKIVRDTLSSKEHIYVIHEHIDLQFFFVKNGRKINPEISDCD